MPHPKSIRVVNRKLLARVRASRCCVCSAPPPSDASHVKTQGSGGPDEEWNLMPFCRKHHIEQHAIGWIKFLEKHPNLKLKLRLLGWNWSTGKLLHNGDDPA